MSKLAWLMGSVVALTGLVASGCGSDDEAPKGATGGKGGTAGSAGTMGGGTAGTTGGKGGSAGTMGGGTAGTTGGKGGTAGSAGTMGGTGGSMGGGGGTTGGAAGAMDGGEGGMPGGGEGGEGGVPGCVGDPPVTEHNVCADIPSQKMGDAGFTISTSAFTNCGDIPDSMTCNGKAFGTGASPELTISGVPSGTNSLALVFKDIAILADNDPATERFGYHWVMWDIPPNTTTLPAGMTGDYHSAEVSGALQWSGRNNYAFFPPSPNPITSDDVRFTCGHVIDNYSLTR
jgi:phosphatidylethanolamine-binding protein (PEBP) family uncharacterized protein